MPGGSEPIDEEYIRARRVLLDALEALQEHRDAVILVGAQAIYIRAGEAELAVAPYTTDADLALDPSALEPEPDLATTMQRAGFYTTDRQIGIWTSTREGDINVDLLVPEAVGGPGSRAARLGGHGKRIARKVHGLEGALVVRGRVTIAALEEGDDRRFDVDVAGPAALLVAKLHKVHERYGNEGRSEDKDALDIYRLLSAIPTEELASAMIVLWSDTRSSSVTRDAIDFLHELFSTADSPGSTMAGRAVGSLEDPETISQSCAFLAGDLLNAIQEAS